MLTKGGIEGCGSAASSEVDFGATGHHVQGYSVASSGKLVFDEIQMPDQVLRCPDARLHESRWEVKIED